MKTTSERIIAHMGGQSNIARQLNIPISTVGSWAQSGSIPSKWQSKLLTIAKSKGLPINASDFIQPCIPSKLESLPHTGAIVAPFIITPAPIPKEEIPRGLFLNELLKLSETKTVLCFPGVGSAFAKKNDQTSVIIAKNRKTILVDIGTTIPTALYRNGLDSVDFDYYHFTHAHADHIGGVEELLLKHRYIVGRKAKCIITPQFEHVLWEHSLKGGSQINELGLLKFRDLIEPIEPEWVKNQPRETYQINVACIHLTIFRTIHTPGDVSQWEKAFWSTGFIVDGQILFSGDTRFDPTLFTDLDISKIETIYHDCQLFNPGIVHAAYDELKTLPKCIKARMYLFHYGDSFETIDSEKDGFLGFTKAFTPYCFTQR